MKECTRPRETSGKFHDCGLVWRRGRKNDMACEIGPDFQNLENERTTNVGRHDEPVRPFGVLECELQSLDQITDQRLPAGTDVHVPERMTVAGRVAMSPQIGRVDLPALGRDPLECLSQVEGVLGLRVGDEGNRRVGKRCRNGAVNEGHAVPDNQVPGLHAPLPSTANGSGDPRRPAMGTPKLSAIRISCHQN